MCELAEWKVSPSLRHFRAPRDRDGPGSGNDSHGLRSLAVLPAELLAVSSLAVKFLPGNNRVNDTRQKLPLKLSTINKYYTFEGSSRKKQNNFRWFGMSFFVKQRG